MPLIKLDVDGVLLDIHTPWLKVYNALADDNLTYAGITRWEMDKLVRPGWEKKIFECRMPELYRRVEPVPGAAALVEGLLAGGHRIVVVTHDFPSHLKHKLAALQRFFPQLKEFVFAKDKHAAVKGGILIDDNPHSKADVLLTQPWNANADPMSYGVRADNNYHALVVVERLSVMKEYRLGLTPVF